MPIFRYTARTETGTNVSQELEADSMASATSMLRARGWLVLAIDERPAESGAAAWNPSSWLWTGSVHIELSLYQLATLLRSGLTLLGALRLAASQSERQRLRRVWEEVLVSIESGSSFADALSEHSCFNRLVVQLVAVGERTGHLIPVLERAALAMEKRRTLRAGLLTTLMYPAIVFVFAVALAIYMVLGVLPKLQVFLRVMGKKLPPMTQSLLDVGDWIQTHGLTALIVTCALILGLIASFFWPRGRVAIDAAALRIPLIGKAIRTAATALFATTFSALLESGVTLTEALRVSERLIWNRRLAAIVGAAREQVMQGEALAGQLDRPNGFMPMLPRMIAVGESSGALDQVLTEVARFHEAQLERLIRRLSALVEPVVIVCVGSLVGYVYISFFMALFAATGPGNNLH